MSENLNDVSMFDTIERISGLRPATAARQRIEAVRATAEQAQLLNLWKWHQRCLANALVEDALLLDCHSFPEEMGDVDICIGFNEDWSKPAKETIDMAVNHFLDHGFSVGVNEPYSNSETPKCNFRYHSLMLEINKRVYLKPGSIELIGGNVNEVIKSFQQRLLIP